MIPKTFWDKEKTDRRFGDDFWSWLSEQPQDAWLLWARTANWDNAEQIFERMIDDPRCDPALASFLFWGCSPSFYVGNAQRYTANTLIHRIVTRAEARGFPTPDLATDRSYNIHEAQAYVAALRKVGVGSARFRLPRALCGPFNGRPAEIPRRYDEATEHGLAEIFAAMDGWLPRSEAEYHRQQAEGGNLSISAKLRLPNPPRDVMRSKAHLDDAAYVEAIYGANSDYQRARRGLATTGGGLTGALERFANWLPDFDVKTTVKWLFGFFVIAMTIAVVMRRINFGVWL